MEEQIEAMDERLKALEDAAKELKSAINSLKKRLIDAEDEIDTIIKDFYPLKF